MVEFDVEDQHKEKIQIELAESIAESLIEYQFNKMIGSFSIIKG